jgi:arylsulfatase A
MKYIFHPLYATFLCALTFSIFAESAPRQIQPNIVLVLADDIGFETLGCYGGQSHPTPNIDLLANDGMRFDSCVATPMCATSRAMLLSGKYNFRNYQTWGQLDASHPTIATQLRSAGYATAMAGKWHLGNWKADAHGKRGPARMGFDHYLSEIPDKSPSKSSGNRFWQTKVIEDGSTRTLPPGRHSEDVLVDYALAFFRANKDRPFFFHHASNLAHRPMVATQSPSPQDLNEHGNAKHFPAIIRKFDDVIGRLRKGLEDLGIAENTIFILTSDNGTDNVWEAKTIHSQWRGHTIAGGKYYANETGTSVPLIIGWPHRVKPASSTRNPLDFTDFLPTLLEIADVKSNSFPSDGISFLPTLLQENAPQSRRVAFTWGSMDGSNRVYHHPILHRQNILHIARDAQWRYFSDGKLFDIATDPLMTRPTAPGSSAEADAARKSLKSALNIHLASRPRLW